MENFNEKMKNIRKIVKKRANERERDAKKNFF